MCPWKSTVLQFWTTIDLTVESCNTEILVGMLVPHQNFDLRVSCFETLQKTDTPGLDGYVLSTSVFITPYEESHEMKYKL